MKNTVYNKGQAVNKMPRNSERYQRINESSASLSRLRKNWILFKATKMSKKLTDNTFKVRALQHINHAKLVGKRHLIPRGKYRKQKGRSVLMYYPYDKVGDKEYTNDAEFIQTCRMSRKAFFKVVDKLKSNESFDEPNFTAEEKDTRCKEYLMAFLSFVGMFGEGSSNNRTRFMLDKGSGTFEIYRNHVIDAIIDNMKDDYYHWPN